MKLILIVICVAIVGVALFAVVDNALTNVGTTTTSSLVSSDAMTITISGEINRPGSYVVSSGASLGDVIEAASGLTSNADTLAFNTEFLVKAKGSYYIAPLYDNGNTCSVSPIEKVNVNEADADDLVSVAGFGKAAASALVAYRATVEFECIEDIMNVNGIGTGTYVTVRDHITLRDAEE